MYQIYALSDPQTKAVRYIGMSKNALKRFATHIAGPDPNKQKANWIQGLINNYQLPFLSILETVGTREEAEQRETYWIQYHLKQKSPLTNISKTPKKAVRGPAIKSPIQMELVAISAEEAATKIDLAVRTTILYLKTGKIPGGYKVAGQWRLDEPDLTKFIAEQKRKAAQKDS